MAQKVTFVQVDGNDSVIVGTLTREHVYAAENDCPPGELTKLYINGEWYTMICGKYGRESTVTVERVVEVPTFPMQRMNAVGASTQSPSEPPKIKKEHRDAKHPRARRQQ